jgi:glycosyltransferase involved in cell wall biosynthesis
MADDERHNGATVASGSAPIRVLRVIARMNVGGPAHHVSLLSGRAFPDRFATLLVAGSVASHEDSFDDLAARQGARLRTVPHLGPEVDPLGDARAIGTLARIARTYRPHIVHTHTAKAGLVGRLAALTVQPRPVIVHTYHGHVLEGYFSRAVSAGFTQMERTLAHFSDRLVAVSQATADDLVRLGVAPPERFEVIPLGLELERYLALPPGRSGPFRAELGLDDDAVLATFVGRMVAIKRADVLLEAVAAARRAVPALVLALVGDGPERPALEERARALGLADAVRFTGYRRDLPEILGGTDLAVLSSDNEGTPVSLIEAAAAARPLVSTRAGGVADVVPRGAGVLVACGDAAALGAAIAEVAGDPRSWEAMGAEARAHARERFTPERLIERVAGLYDRLLAR